MKIKKNIFITKISSFNFSILEINIIFLFLYFFATIILFSSFGDLILSKSFPRKMNLLEGDSYSYLSFSFENLNTILSQHRSFGLPLILKGYIIVDSNLKYWPLVTFFFYILSNNIMLNFFLKNNINKLFASSFSALIFCSSNVWEFTFGWTELWAISFFMLSLAILSSSISKPSQIKFITLSLTIFMTYQIRPSFIFLLIIPIFYAFLFFLKKNYSLFKKIVFASFIPLAIFLTCKFFITKDLGLTPFTGVQLSGHAVFYLDDETIKNMSNKDNIVFAKKILEKKKKLSHPCNPNITNNLEKEYIHQYCWGIYLMESWVEMIKQETGITPFLNDNKNIESWKFMNLDSFFGKIKNNILIDKKLKSFSIEILQLNLKDHFIWICKSIPLILTSFIAHPGIIKIIIISFSSIVFLIFFSKKKNFNKMKFFNNNNEEYIFFSILIYSLISMVFFAALHVPNQRTASVQFIFLIPACVSYILYRIVKKKIN